MSRRGRPRATALALLLLLPLAVVAPHAVPSSAQTTEGDTATEEPVARVTLAAIDPVVASGDAARWAVVVEHDGEVAWERLEVVAELHGPLGSRSALRAALAGGSVPAVLARDVVTVSASPVLPNGVVRVAGAVPLDGGALGGADSAVHPLRLAVLADGEEVGRIDTAVVRIGAAPVARLATTLVWPLDAPPARDGDGDPSGGLDPLTVAGGRLDTLLSALDPVLDAVTAAAVDGEDGTNGVSPLAALAPGLALSVPVHLLEDLTLRGDGVPTGVVEDLLDGPPPSTEAVEPAALRAALLHARIRTTVRTLPAGPLSAPYGDADLTRLLASGPAVRPLAGRAVLEGPRRTSALVGREPARIMLLGAPVVPATLDLLPVRTTIVPHDAIESPDLALDIALGEPVRTLRSPTGRPITALVGDPFLTLALGASTRALAGDPVRAAHEVLVRSAMVHLEAPGREGRALVLLPPDGFDPDPRFAAELLARLAAAPWLEPAPPETLAGGPVGAAEPARLRDAPPDAVPARLAATLAVTERELALLVDALDTSGGTGADPDRAVDDVMVGPWLLTDASDTLMRATSRAFTGDVDRATALLAGVRRGVDTAFGTTTLDVADVTLTDRDGTVPLTLTRTGGLPLRVRVEVTGPAALTWTDGRVTEFALAAGEERAIEVPVRSSATGVFPVTVRVTDPSGERVLARDIIGVRATAVAGPALALIATTVVVLVIIGSLRQRRRGLALRTVAEDMDDGTDAEEVTR